MTMPPYQAAIRISPLFLTGNTPHTELKCLNILHNYIDSRIPVFHDIIAGISVWDAKIVLG